MEAPAHRQVNLRRPGGTGPVEIVVLPDDLPQRLRLLATAYFFGYALNWVQWELVPLLTVGWREFDSCGESLREPLMMLICVLAFVASRRLAPSRLLRLACALQLVSVLDVSAAAPNVIRALGLEHAVHAVGIPWSCVMICVFPLIIPASRGLHVVMALTAALTMATWHTLMGALGAPVASMALLVDWTLPNLICAALAIVCSHLVYATARAVSEVRSELTRLGSYQLIERIGVGGMGEVWLGKHQMLARPAAIKVINAERIAAEGRKVEVVLERFEREAQAMAGLRSTHTVEIYDYGRTDEGAFFYVMELLDGIDLEELVTTHGPQPCSRVLRLWRQMCLSLAEAHEQGLVHRDLKPANMYICRQGWELDVIKVLDFGLVLRQTIKGSGEARLTEERTVYGTPAFMSPEQALGEDDIDHRADLYALGCVIYYLLVGRPPFEESTSMKTMIAQVRKDVMPPSAQGVELPPAMEQLLLACLAKDRDARPADARVMLERIDGMACDRPWGDEERQAWWARLSATRFTTAIERLPTTRQATVEPSAPTETRETASLDEG